MFLRVFLQHWLCLLDSDSKRVVGFIYTGCRVGREVTRPGPSPDPDKEISTIRLFRRCGSWLYVATTFTSSGDMFSNVSALDMVLF